MTTKKKAKLPKKMAKKLYAKPLQDKVVEQHVKDTMVAKPLGFDEAYPAPESEKHGNAFTRFVDNIIGTDDPDS
jgi:hypothetical protein